ncbi:protocadherin gamma-B5-like [Empidonax traillii]|uniref:protocadherin gamma-B5-like n=1 Tax=Empidonax traillii TaxID=164674 RepID=UPI000FFCEDF4|nr:protocadherin gamma-B5-like [Empidonax traillii]
MCSAGRRWGRRQRVLLWGVLLASWEAVWGQLHYSVPEEMPKDSFVGDVAKDLGLQLPEPPDRGVRVVSEDRTQYFTLHGKTGHLVTAERIDREQLCESVEQCVLRCELIVDGQMQVYGIEVEIMDINDNAPSFKDTEIVERMSETTAPGSRFSLAEARDPDSGRNSLQSYELSGDEHFSLAVQTGPGGDQRPELVLAKALDREEAAFHELVLRAMDGGDPARTGTARIRAGQRQEPSERREPALATMAGGRRQRRGPAGGRALLLPAVLLCLCCRAAPERLPYAIPEELPTGSLVGPLARDLGLSPDELSARKLRLSEDKQYFTVNEENGNLYVNERLDREELCGESASCSVSFEALVHNPLNVFHIEVTIKDVNDNSPSFSKAALELEIGEWTLPGARFPLEMAQDADAGSNSLLTYELTSNPSFSLALKERPGGKKQPELVLERALDREKQSSFELVLTAVDGGDPARSGTVQIRVNVTDANDNPPVFSKSVYEARVAENLPAGSLVLKVRATDADAGSNGRVFYSFGSVPAGIRELFTVESETGEIRTVGPLDFEKKSKYSFELEATDGGGLTDHCEVKIDITDDNDNAPEITILSLSSPVPEDAPAGTVVALLKIRDRDSGENGEVSCELSGEAPLSIVASSGGSYKVVTASALDREQASEHRVTVVARDRGRPALWSEAELVLEVSDVNDNGTLPYSYNLCVAAPARAAAEAAWPPPPLPILPAEELLAGEPCDKPSPSSSAVAGEPPTDPDAPQLPVGEAGRASLGSARCLQCREEAASAAVDREEREEGRSAAAPPAADRLDRWIAGFLARRPGGL